MGNLRVRLLGGLEVEGFAPHQVGSRKARAVVKALAAAQGRPVPVDRLVEIVWPEGPPSNPGEQVGVLVSRLRGTLGSDRLVRGDAGYELVCDWLDVSELEDRVGEAAARLSSGAIGAARAAADAALALARGSLLPGDEGEWVEPARAAAERLVARAHGLAADSALAAGDAAAGAAAAARALDHDPYDEAALRLLMRAHVAAGRPASALDAYARVRARLAEDLGVSPTAETEELHGAVLRGEVPRGSAAVQDPAPTAGDTPRLVGREAELAWLDERLAEVARDDGVVGNRLVVVEGEPGIGKSALVETWSAAAGGALVLTARCDGFGRDLPLQPVLDALAAHVAGLAPDDVRTVLGDEGDLIGPLLGCGRSDHRGPRPTELPDPDARRAALFAGLLAVIERAAEGRPIVLVVDDLHLAGEVTVAWLASAARRARRLLVVATRRPEPAGVLEPGRTLTLGPLDLGSARRLVGDLVGGVVGDDRAEALYRRSGGHPLFLLALAAEPPGADAPGGPASGREPLGSALPAAITELVRGRLEALGSAARTLVAASVLGSDVDLDLLAGVLDTAPAALLDDLEAAAGAGVLAERGTGFAFAHELVREGAAASASSSRRALLHREAARMLFARGDAELLVVARHARLGGDARLAAQALAAAATQAAERGDHRGSVRLLDDAVALADEPAVRLARARARLAVRDAPGAAADAGAALAAGAGVEGLEVAGWVAYYRRDLAAARRYAEEGAARADDPGLRASCLCLAGRVRQTQGDLADAEERLAAAVAVAPAPLRPLAEVWLGDLRVYQGRPAEAADLSDRGLLDRSQLGHPFGLPHGLMTRCYAAGMAGRAGDALRATAEFLDEMARMGEPGVRYVPAASNFRAWVLRSLGRGEEAAELNERARELSPAAGREEPYNQGTLDLVEGALLAGDLDAADRLLSELRGLGRAGGTEGAGEAGGVEEAGGVDAAEGTDAVAMAWHQRERAALARARLALAGGDAERAAALAGEAAAGATRRGSVRHARVAEVVEALALADAGEAVDGEQLERLLAALDPVAGLEAWRWAAEIADRTGTDRARTAAERRVGILVAATPADDRAALQRWIARRLG